MEFLAKPVAGKETIFLPLLPQTDAQFARGTQCREWPRELSLETPLIFQDGNLDGIFPQRKFYQKGKAKFFSQQRRVRFYCWPEKQRGLTLGTSGLSLLRCLNCGKETLPGGPGTTGSPRPPGESPLEIKGELNIAAFFR